MGVRDARVAARLLLLGLFAAAILSVAAIAGSAQTASVVVAPVKGTITPVIADHLREGVELAEREGRIAFVIELDTPGGLDTSMREIIQTLLTAEVPTIVYVAPQGARAASAGAIITMAAHIAAMSPGTAIGAATPVDLEGGDISMKIINDAAAYAESIARARGRNIEFAGDAVRDAKSVTADEAVRIGAVDLIAPTTSALLDAIDGRTVMLASGNTVTLATANAEIERYALRGFRRVLAWLADPNIAFLFLSIGTLAIIYELANPSMGAAGITGAIMIVLALFSLSVLPVNAAGAILILVAVGMFVGELFTPGVGVFAAGGTASLLVGGIFLFRGSVGVSLGTLIPVVIVVGSGSAIMGRLAWRSRRLPSATGAGSMLGRTTIVQRVAGASGSVVIDGTWWNVRPASGTDLWVGQAVRVVGMEGLDLLVQSEEEESWTDSPSA